jgi:PAS domain S-box-containing protein
MPDPRHDDQRDAELARSWLAAIVDSSDEVIISKMLDGVITSWNHAAERLFGWTAVEAVGQHITLIIPLERRSEEDEVLARIRRGERTDNFETVRVAKGGQLRGVSITVSPIKDASGRIVGASKIARDVTERQRLEEERASWWTMTPNPWTCRQRCCGVRAPKCARRRGRLAPMS